MGSHQASQIITESARQTRRLGRCLGERLRSGTIIKLTGALGSGKTSYNSYHCWAHWYDGRHWRPVDISEADKVVTKDPAKAAWFFGHLDQNRLSLTFGRDITLEPAQQGGELNYFVFPYAEADGNKMKLDKSMWLFSWEDR